jgi:NAD(P)-dependent dehydrogenase (short-subunit alcohol dehydrogenase family)
MNNVFYPSLKNKQILVTGATSGIGKGVCEELLKQEAKVVGIGRDISKIEDDLLKDTNFTFLKFDLLNIEDIELLISDYVKNNLKFDGMVSCAGKEETIPLNIYKVKKMKALYDLNVFSGVEILRLLSKKKFCNDNSSIVFISSVMGELGQPGIVGYCGTKSAILGVVRSSSLELSRRNIRVNAVSPGVVETPMSKKFFETLADDNIQRIKSMHPLGIGKIEQVTPSVLFLLSKQSSWITGQNIKIDGGYSVQ